MRALLTAAAALVLVSADGPENKPDLDALLEERIVINRKYKKEGVEAAAEYKLAKPLAEYEAAVGDGWIELIEYAKKSGDPKLKQIVLRLEYYDELRNYVYDFEYAESKKEKQTAVEGRAKYDAKVKQIPNQ